MKVQIGFMHNKFFRLGLSTLLTFWVGFGSFCQPAAALTDAQKLVAEVWRIVDHSYLDDTFNHQNWREIRQKALAKPLQNQQATYTAIGEMLKSLDDPFTRFLDPEQYRSLQVNTSGELTGVGLQIALDPDTGVLEVVAPIAGSPAEKAGIKPRDHIIKIEGFSTTKLTLDEAATKMRGPIGSTVTLVIQRDNEGEKEIQLVRDRISLNPVLAELHPSSHGVPIGYIRLTQFNANAPAQLAQAINSLEQKGAAAYILDLRNNPGGLLQAGIEIARLWLNSGTIVYTVNRYGIQGSFEAIGSALTNDPLVVLVNQGTASASEILAGALQDNGRAVLVGETTFGKGLIQSLFELSNGSGLAVTIAKYETPKHKDINKLGIQPDKRVVSNLLTRAQIATEADTQYQAAVNLITNTSVVAGTT